MFIFINITGTVQKLLTHQNVWIFTCKSQWPFVNLLKLKFEWFPDVLKSFILENYSFILRFTKR